MLSRIFPEQIGNRYRGNRLALWILAPIVLFNTAISLGAIFARDGGAQSADGIPLSSYPPDAAGAVIGVVAYLGLADLLLCFLFALTLLRYRAMVPLMYALIVVDSIGHRGIGWMKPIVRMAGTPTGSYVTQALFALSVLGFILSLLGKNYATERQSVSGASPPRS